MRKTAASFLIMSMITPIWAFRLVAPSLFRTHGHASMRGVLFANARVTFSNLPLDATEEEIHNLIFQNAGNNCKTVRLSSDRKSGTAIIDYDSLEEANSAAEALSTLVVHERVVKVDVTTKTTSEKGVIKPRRSLTDRTCYIANLDPSTSEEDVHSLCEEYVGHDLVRKITLLRDRETGANFLQ